jgi:hypothetical protein
VANTIVEIAKLKLKDTTAADGMYSIMGSASAIKNSAITLSGAISKFGTYPISSGSRGNYIIDIPTGYDKDTATA